MARSDMPLNIHVLMQNTYDQHSLFFRDVKNYMGMVFKPAQLWGKPDSTAALDRIVRQSIKALMQAVEVGLRLGQTEIQDRVFVDCVKIGRSFRGKSISGHRL